MYSGISEDGTWVIGSGLGLEEEGGVRSKANEKGCHNEGEATRSA